MINLDKSCTICKHINDGPSFHSACFLCDDKDHFDLDKKQLRIEYESGLRSRKDVKRILEEDKRNQGIPGQLRLTEGDII